MAKSVVVPAALGTNKPSFSLESFLFPTLSGQKRAWLLYLYYLLIIVLLLLLYGRGDFTTAPFVYQGF